MEGDLRRGRAFASRLASIFVESVTFVLESPTGIL